MDVAPIDIEIAIVEIMGVPRKNCYFSELS